MSQTYTIVAGDSPSSVAGRFYGDGGTIHHTTSLDVEVCNGQVVAVWFRCQPLPFRETKVSIDRAREMRRIYRDSPLPEISGVQLTDFSEH